MNTRQCFWRILCLMVALCCITTRASATFTHYYYDAQGRLLGSFSTADEERASRTDAADNPSHLRVFPVAPPQTVSTLTSYGALIADQSLTSADGRFTFDVQEDGNLVIYGPSQVLWASGTNAQPGSFSISGDGNLYFFGPDDSLIWRTYLSAPPTNNAQLVMQTDGNLVLYENGAAVWSTGTGGH